MRILSINLGNFSSTGGIVNGIKEKAFLNNIEYVSAYAVDIHNKEKEKNDWIIGKKFGRKCSVALGMLTGFNGCFSFFSTVKLIIRIKKYNPDIIHFHNLHNNYVNLYLLFNYVKKINIRILWTLHDCWSFTGQCPYFEMYDCEKWMTGCHSCLRFKEYPKSFVDRTKTMWKLKRKWFTEIRNLTIVTPSIWLSELVKQSFLREYSVKVIYNGINLSIFKPIKSDFRKQYNCMDKYIVLGVAFDWGERKGLDVFIELSKRLSPKYQILLVGTNDNIDNLLPQNIISIHRTANQNELAEIYSAADVFVNPTRDEAFGLVNIEALACGTPGVTFRTGGSPECYDKTCGVVVEKNDIDALESNIIRICETKPFSSEACVKFAKSFDMNDKFQEYIDLYKEILYDKSSKN